MFLSLLTVNTPIILIMGHFHTMCLPLSWKQLSYVFQIHITTCHHTCQNLTCSHPTTDTQPQPQPNIINDIPQHLLTHLFLLTIQATLKLLTQLQITQVISIK